MVAAMVATATVGGLGVVPLVLCRSPVLSTTTDAEQWRQEGSTVTSIFGKLYDTTQYMNRHPGGSQVMSDYWGQDASALFPRIPFGRLPHFCIDPSKTTFLETNLELTCETTDDSQCHKTLLGPKAVQSHFGASKVGDRVLTPEMLENMLWIQIGNSIYNVTSYVNGLKSDQGIVPNPSHPNAFLYRPVHEMIVGRLNQDATDLYNNLFFSTKTIQEE